MDNTTTQPQQAQVSPAQPAPPEQTQGKKKLFILIGIVVVVLLLGAGAGYYLYSGMGSQNESASQQDTLMATVGEREIYESDVVQAIQQQYDPEAIDVPLIQKFLGILVERSILDIEAKQLGILVSDEEITGLVGTDAQTPIRQEAKYNLLKEKVISSQTKNVQANVIGFWIPSYDYPQLPEYDEQRSQVAVALQDIFVKLQDGQTPLEVMEYTSQTYPDLPKLSLNGYIYNKTEDVALMQTPQTFVIGALDPESTSADPDLYEAFEGAEQGEVLFVIRSDGSGGSVAKVENITTEGFATYEEFLSAKTDELVTIHFQP